MGGFRSTRSVRFNNNLATLVPPPVGTVKNLAGTATGLSTTSASITRVRTLNGSVAGSGTSTATILRTRSLTGSSSGTSSLSAQMQRLRSLSGIALGSGTALGTSTRRRRLTGDSTGISAVTGTITFIAAPPSVPNITSLTSSGLNVTITASTPTGATQYRFFRDGVLVRTQSSNVYVNGVPSDGTYVFTVSAGNAYGSFSTASSGVSIVIDTTAPTVPVVTLTAMGRDVTLHWGNNPDVAVYGIRRNGIDLTTSSNATSYLDTVPADGDWTYTVSARDVYNNWSSYSTPVTITVDTIPPGLPQVTTDTGALTATLTWGVISDASAYEVWRDNVLLQTVTTTSYTDTLMADGVYVYKIRAKDAAGNYSAFVTIKLAVDKYSKANRPSLFRVPLLDTSLGRAPLVEQRRANF